MSIDPRLADAMETVGIITSSEAEALREELERMTDESLNVDQLVATANADIAANRARRS
jgi:Ni,Fe-hydrogenase III small subunit